MDLVLLEYYEKTGTWHYNTVDPKTMCPHDKPGPNDWEVIAFTTLDKADIFSNMIDCKLHKKELYGNHLYTADDVRKEWKLFCYMYNEIVNTIEITDTLKESVKKNFESARALARLGNGHFSDLRENEELSWAWEYDPMSFKDSNF